MENRSKLLSDSRIGFGLDISAIVLKTLQDVARMSPVPYLQEAAGLALGIVNVIQGVRGNKEAFKRLAADACELVYAILRMHQDQGIVSTTLLENIRGLLMTLTSIEGFAKEMSSRHLIVRLISYQSDTSKVQQYREELRQSLDVFGLESSIYIQGGISRIAEQHGELLKELRKLRPRAVKQPRWWQRKRVDPDKEMRGKARRGRDMYERGGSKRQRQSQWKRVDPEKKVWGKARREGDIDERGRSKAEKPAREDQRQRREWVGDGRPKMSGQTENSWKQKGPRKQQTPQQNLNFP